SLGVLTSVQITMLYLQENLRQQTLANVFGTSQPTISRAINNVLNILDIVLPPPPQPKDLEVYSAAGKIHLRQQVEDQKEHAI
ncbi:transposase family protein, partial [Corynebacterium matruchotii]